MNRSRRLPGHVGPAIVVETIAPGEGPRRKCTAFEGDGEGVQAGLPSVHPTGGALPVGSRLRTTRWRHLLTALSGSA